MESITGFKPLAINCTDNLLLKVVFPEEEGPETRMTFKEAFFSIVSAIRAIFFSCKASAILIKSNAFLFLQTTLNSPIVLTLMILFHFTCSLNISNSLGIFSNSSSWVGLFLFGIRNNIPS